MRVQRTWQSKYRPKSAASESRLAKRYLRFLPYYGSLTLLHLTNAGGREGRNWILPPGGREVCLQAGPQPHVRVHGQLHQKAQEPAGEVHDEQRPRELHNPTSKIQIRQELINARLSHLSPKHDFILFQVITNKETQETLLCIAYVFEVNNIDNIVYKCYIAHIA